MAIKFRSPFTTKEDPAEIVRKIDHLQSQLTKSYTPPVVMSLRDDELFQVIKSQMGWSGIQKVTETQTVNGQMIAYQFCPVVTAVVNKTVDMGRAGRWCLEDKKEKEVEKSNHPFYKLFKRPNPLQNWGRFFSQAYTFQKVFGRCYILPVIGAGFQGPKNAAAMYVIPNWMVTVNYTNKLYGQTKVENIIRDYTVSGLNGTVPVTDMIVWEDTTVSLSTDSQYKIESQSRLYSIGDQIVNFQTSYAARRTLLEKRGALGAWVNNNPKDAGGANPITNEERDKILKDFDDRYGVDRGKFPWMLTTSFLKWEQAGFATKDLLLFEEAKDTGLLVYDAFGLSVFLSPWADQTSYTNLEKAERKAYTGTIIPDCEGLSELFTNAFELEKDGLTFEVYFDHLECLQKSKKEEADALNSFTSAIDKPYKGKVISKQEYRIFLSNFLPQGTEFDPEATDGDFFDGSPTQTIVAQ